MKHAPEEEINAAMLQTNYLEINIIATINV